MSRLHPAVRWGGALALVAAAGWILWQARGSFAALAAALILAYALEPLVEILEARRVSRSVALLLVACGASILAAVGLLYVVPELLDQVRTFAASARPERLTDPEAWPQSVRTFVAEHRADIDTAKAELIVYIKANAAALAQAALRWVAGATTSVAGLVVTLLNVVIVPVFAYYLVVEQGAIRRRCEELLPPASRSGVLRIAGEIDAVLRRFLRGQLVVAAALGAIYAVGLMALGTPLGLIVGFGAGLLNVVPYLGLAAGLLPALLLSFMAHQSWPLLGGVVAVFVVAQFVEGWYLTPKLLGDSVGLHPLVVMLAVMVGGEAFGFVGIMLAVPVTAALAVLWREAVGRYQRSAWYVEGAGDAG